MYMLCRSNGHTQTYLVCGIVHARDKYDFYWSIARMLRERINHGAIIIVIIIFINNVSAVGEQRGR
jgi:hypothetical protein